MVYCLSWEVPAVDPPTEPITVHVSVVCARCVLKKQSAIRIPNTLSRTQPILTMPNRLASYVEFSTFIKSNTRMLEDTQNVIYFSDFNDEQQFIFSIQCLWAVMAKKSDVSILAVTLNADLAKRLVSWEKVSESVIQDLTPPSNENSKRPSIASLQATSLRERRQKAVEIMAEEAEMDFSGPIYRRQQDESVGKITVWRRYILLLLSLNSLMFTIDHQFLDINRTTPIDEAIVTEICKKVLETHYQGND